MKIEFYKYQGTGNDFIMIDGRNLKAEISSENIQKLCHRRFGIGADGLIIIRKHIDYDFEMIYYNADGSQSFCGNGSRCAQAFAKKIGLAESDTDFLAIDGQHQGKIGISEISTKMRSVENIEKRGEDYLIDTGSPHYIRYVDDVAEIDVLKLGREIRNSPEFVKKGINVNFVSQEGEQLRVRTYERGVEAETYSCGTGVTAAAISHIDRNRGQAKSVDIVTSGGKLSVDIQSKNNGTYHDIWLTGPAEEVFYGHLEL